MIIKIPDECPACQSKLELVKDQLFCRNLACPAQLGKKIEHLARTLQIKGLGPKTIEKLNIQDITEIFYLERDEVIVALGSEKLADKLLDEINKASKADLANCLAAFSIPLVGNTLATKLASVVKHISEINKETCEKAGIGPKATANILYWLDTEFKELQEFLPFSWNSIVGKNQENKPQICITGKLTSFKTKALATQELEKLGFTVSDSVTKTTKYLVDESGGNSSKRQKAEEYGISIINNLLDFIKVLNK